MHSRRLSAVGLTHPGAGAPHARRSPTKSSGSAKSDELDLELYSNTGDTLDSGTDHFNLAGSGAVR